MVIERVVSETTLLLDVSPWAEGTYFVEWQGVDGARWIDRFVVIH